MIDNFGRADKVDHGALARLVSSISRFLEPEQAVAAVQTAEVEVLDSRPVGGAWGGWTSSGNVAARGVGPPPVS